MLFEILRARHQRLSASSHSHLLHSLDPPESFECFRLDMMSGWTPEVGRLHMMKAGELDTTRFYEWQNGHGSGFEAQLDQSRSPPLHMHM
jgi:hypothetical protein